MNRYRNLWHKSLNVPKPPFYENDARCVLTHRGVRVFKLFGGFYDLVLADACIAQRAGGEDVAAIDDLLDGKKAVCEEVKQHINANGGHAISYRDEMAREQTLNLSNSNSNT
jgi:hypothetical protein